MTVYGGLIKEFFNKNLSENTNFVNAYNKLLELNKYSKENLNNITNLTKVNGPHSAKQEEEYYQLALNLEKEMLSKGEKYMKICNRFLKQGRIYYNNKYGFHIIFKDNSYKTLTASLLKSL